MESEAVHGAIGFNGSNNLYQQNLTSDAISWAFAFLLIWFNRMWSFSCALISVNRPQSFSMLIAQLDMTGYSANYLLGKRLFCALKGDVSLAEDCFRRCTAPGCCGG